MARVKGGVHAKKNHKAVLKRAKGHYGNRSRSFKSANESVMHSMQYAFRVICGEQMSHARIFILHAAIDEMKLAIDEARDERLLRF